MPPIDPALKSRYPNLFGPRQYVFIVTFGRSGSTLLQNLLNRMPGTCIRGENANALTFLAQSVAAMVKSEPMAGLRKTGQITGPDHPWYGAEAINPWQFGRALADVFVRDVLIPPRGCEVLGFKEIRYHLVDGDPMAAFRFMRETFPEVRFLINTRDHEATAQSGWWKTMPRDRVMRELAEAEALFDKVQAHFPRVTLRMRYDDYATSPEALEPLFRFLDRPFDVEMVRSALADRLTHTGTKAPPAA